MEPNCVQYLVYFDDVSSCAQLEEKKNDIFKHVERDFAANDASCTEDVAHGVRCDGDNGGIFVPPSSAGVLPPA